MHELLEAEGWATPNTHCRYFAPIPSKSGVYLFLEVMVDFLGGTRTDRILYVGMTKDLKKRHKSHELQQAFNGRYVQTWFKEVPERILRSEEKNLIKRFNPPFNVIHRKAGFDA